MRSHRDNVRVVRVCLGCLIGMEEELIVFDHQSDNVMREPSEGEEEDLEEVEGLSRNRISPKRFFAEKNMPFSKIANKSVELLKKRWGSDE